MPNGKKSDRKLSRHRKNSRTLSLSPRGGHLTLSLSSLMLMGESQKEGRKSLAPNDKTLCVPVSRRAIQNPLLQKTKDQGNREHVHNQKRGSSGIPEKNRETKRAELRQPSKASSTPPEHAPTGKRPEWETRLQGLPIKEARLNLARKEEEAARKKHGQRPGRKNLSSKRLCQSRSLWHWPLIRSGFLCCLVALADARHIVGE